MLFCSSIKNKITKPAPTFSTISIQLYVFDQAIAWFDGMDQLKGYPCGSKRAINQANTYLFDGFDAFNQAKAYDNSNDC